MQKSELTKLDLPDCPGVYLFTKGRGRGKKVLYVGKATSLRDRVRSYFDDDLIATRGPRIVDMVTLADKVSFEPTPTVLEALVREAALIRAYKPKANVEGKDDKSFLYAVITDEPFPRVLPIRGKDIDFKARRADGIRYKHAYGPFPSGNQLREALRLIRRIFPFFDTRHPIGEGGKHDKAKIEFNQQIGQYPDKHTNRALYLRSIRNVSLLLSGKVKTLRATLKKDMARAVQGERFEAAAMTRNQLFAIDHVQDVSLIKEDREDREGSAQDMRIEAFDIAHLSGTNAIGVMTVLVGGIPSKKDYRTFTIRGTAGKNLNNDIASLTEVLSRRLMHEEWPLPRAVVVDGGTTHKKAAQSLLKELGVHIPVVAVVKDERHRPREVIGARLAGITDADAVLGNAEAHRFSLGRHRWARRKALRGK